MLIKTLKLNKKKENIRSLLNNFITLNQYRRIYADEDSLICSSFLNRIEFTVFEEKVKITIKPKIELLFIPFAVFFLTYFYCDPFLLCVSFALISYVMFVYEQIVIYSGIKRQLQVKTDITE